MTQLRTALLQPNISYTQDWQDRLKSDPLVAVKGTVYSDKAGTLYIDESDDKVTVTQLANKTVSVNTTTEQDWVKLTKRWYRFRYVNDANAQGEFILLQDINKSGVQLTGRTTTKTVTISSGTSLSTEVDLEGYQLCAIEMPSAWDAAALTFQGSSTSSGTYKDIKANGLEVTEPGSNLTATAGVINAIDVNAMALAPIRYLKIRSGTSGSAVNQTANRTLTLILKV